MDPNSPQSANNNEPSFTPGQPEQAQPAPQVFDPQQSATPMPSQPVQPAASQVQPNAGASIVQPTQPIQQSATVQPTPSSPFGAQSYAAPGLGMPLTPQSQSKGRRKLVLASVAGLAILLVGSSAAAYFGYLVPNKPENLWATALKRTGDGYDKLIEYSDNNKDAKSIKYKGNLKLSGSLATDGTLEGESDEKNAIFKGDLGVVTSRLNVEARVIDAANSENPDIYVKATGLKGLDSMMGTGGMIGSFENQWIAIDHTLLDTVQQAALNEGGLSGVGSLEASELTAAEMTQIAKAIGEVNKQYLFSTDEGKAVLRTVKTVGKEKQDDREVYHYVVGLHKQHTKDYLNALATKLDGTPIKKILNGKSVKEAVQLDDILKEVDKYDDKDTADVWVDTKTKLIRTIRFTDKDTPTDYLDLGLHYTGGDSIPFVLKFHSEEDGQNGTINASVVVNMKTNVVDLGFDFDVVTDKESKQHETGKATLSATPSKDSIKVDKPTGAKSLQELMGPLFGGYLGAGSSGGTMLEDIEI